MYNKCSGKKSSGRTIVNLCFSVVGLAILTYIVIKAIDYIGYVKANGMTWAQVCEDIMPNVVKTQQELLKCFIQTLQMVGLTSAISAGLGVVFGVLLVVTQKDNILECQVVFQTLDKIINIFRSIPFIILVALLIKVTRQLMGTSIGVQGAVFPLVVATVPFFSRQIHAALCEIDNGVVEAARSMGQSPFEIITRVYLREGLPGMIRGATITVVNIIALTAMAGTVGAGGLGDYAIRYGYQRMMTDVTVVTILIILAMVTLIQTLGTFLERKLTH